MTVQIVTYGANFSPKIIIGDGNPLPIIGSCISCGMDDIFSVGEWVAKWKVPNAVKKEYEMFANAEMDVYGKATFGWAHWTLTNLNNHSSMDWMINNGYISLKS